MLVYLKKYQFLIFRSAIIFVNIGAVVVIKNITGDEEATHLSLVLTLNQLMLAAGFYGGRVEVFIEKKNDVSVILFGLLGIPLIFLLHSLFLADYRIIGKFWEVGFIIGNSLLLYLAFYFRSLGSDWRSHFCELRIPIILSLMFMLIFKLTYQEFFMLGTIVSLILSMVFLFNKIPLEIVQLNLGVIKEKEFHNRRLFSQLTTTLSYIYQNLDSLLVYYFFDVETALMYYFLSRLAKILTPVYLASNQYFVKYYAEIELGDRRRLWHQNIRINLMISCMFFFILCVAIFFIQWQKISFLTIEKSHYLLVGLLFLCVVIQNSLGASGYLIMFSGKRVYNSIIIATGLMAQLMFLFFFKVNLTNVVASSVISVFVIFILHYTTIRYKVFASQQ